MSTAFANLDFCSRTIKFGFEFNSAELKEASDSAPEVDPNLDAACDASGNESVGRDLVSVVSTSSSQFETLQLDPGNSHEEVQEYIKSSKPRPLKCPPVQKRL